jgi:S1-C subfamily serine protease
MTINRFLKLAFLSLSIFSLNCVSYTNCIGLDDIKDSLINITHKHNKTVLPYDSFVKIIKDVATKEGMPVFETIASGIIISQSETETRILTARHFCLNTNEQDMIDQVPEELKPLQEAIAVIDVENKGHQIKMFSYDSQFDICLIVAEKIEQPAVTLSPVAPERGEKVYNIAAPLGISDGKAVLLFEGYYAGETIAAVTGTKASLYSIPTTSGSSGSAILNEHGELIGITFAGLNEFKQVCMAVPWNVIVKFVNFTNLLPEPADIDGEEEYEFDE